VRYTTVDCYAESTCCQCCSFVIRLQWCHSGPKHKVLYLTARGSRAGTDGGHTPEPGVCRRGGRQLSISMAPSATDPAIGRTGSGLDWVFTVAGRVVAAHGVPLMGDCMES
jgi:hypothetical protein